MGHAVVPPLLDLHVTRTRILGAAMLLLGTGVLTRGDLRLLGAWGRASATPPSSLLRVWVRVRKLQEHGS